MKVSVICGALVFGCLVSTNGNLFAAYVVSNSTQTREVDLFQAAEAGEIEVKFIPKDAKEANLLIKNNLDQPVAIRLPDVVAGVPAEVLAQFQQPFNQQQGFNQFGNNQAVGGPIGGAGPIFNIPPGKMRKIEMPVVCLQHGNPNPSPHVPYELVPITGVTEDSHVAQSLSLLGAGSIKQKTAQALAWHYMDGMSFDQLRQKGSKLITGRVVMFFDPSQVEAAEAIAQKWSKAKGKGNDSLAASK